MPADERLTGPSGDPDGVDDVLDTDPSGAGRDGLAGDLGVSSGRPGPLHGSGPEATHGAEDTTAAEVRGDDPAPEQSPDPAVGGPETPTPEDTDDYRRHESEPGTAQRHHT